MRTHAKQGKRTGANLRFSVLSFGLGAFFATLLIYAGTVTPFLRYENILNFVGSFAYVSLATLLLCSAAFLGALLCGKTLPHRIISGVGGILYLVSSAAFCYLALMGVNDPLPLYLGAIACGIGDCCLCVVWSRRFRTFDLRSALFNVAVACLLAIVAYTAYVLLAPVVGVGLFLTLAAVAVVMPLASSASRGADTTRASGNDAPVVLRSLTGFADVVTKPALGLLVFSFVMGLTNFSFVEHYATYLAASSIAALTLAIIAFFRPKRPLTHLLYRDLVPFLAIVALAVPTVVMTLAGPSSITMFFTLLLYTFAAFLTLATLCAIANASEFSSDLVFITALVLFSVASLAGLLCSTQLSADMISVTTTVVTTAYAFLTVAMRTTKPDTTVFDQEAFDDEASPVDRNRHGHENDHDRIAEACARLSEEHRLTAREREILQYLAEGHSGAYISDVLFISPNTARTHIHNIYRKLDVSSREDILRMAKG